MKLCWLNQILVKYTKWINFMSQPNKNVQNVQQIKRDDTPTSSYVECTSFKLIFVGKTTLIWFGLVRSELCLRCKNGNVMHKNFVTASKCGRMCYGAKKFQTFTLKFEMFYQFVVFQRKRTERFIGFKCELYEMESSEFGK